VGGSDERPVPGGKLEYAVLVCVWEGGAVTAREVHERVGAPAGLVYTTTARVLDRLHAKGLVARERSGKAFTYRAAAARPEIDRARMSRTLGGLLAGAPLRPALAALVEAVESIDPALLDELAQAVEAARRSRREP
jgi:predicted transcriptional regulator